MACLNVHSQQTTVEPEENNEIYVGLVSAPIRIRKEEIQVKILSNNMLSWLDMLISLFWIEIKWWLPKMETRRNEIRDGTTGFCELSLKSYVYWTVHHLDSWIKRDQLDLTCFIISLFNAQHVSRVNTSILRSLRFICWVISWFVLLWFDVCWCYVVVWLGWCGIRMEAPARIRIPHHTTPAKPQRNTNTHRTRAIQPMK